MASSDRPVALTFDRSTAEGRRAEMAYLDSLSDDERAAFEPGHRYVTANPRTTSQRETLLAQQLVAAENSDG